MWVGGCVGWGLPEPQMIPVSNGLVALDSQVMDYGGFQLRLVDIRRRPVGEPGGLHADQSALDVSAPCSTFAHGHPLTALGPLFLLLRFALLPLQHACYLSSSPSAPMLRPDFDPGPLCCSDCLLLRPISVSLGSLIPLTPSSMSGWASCRTGSTPALCSWTNSS